MNMGADQSNLNPPSHFASFLPGETPEDSPILRHPSTLHSFIVSAGPGLDTMNKCMLKYFSDHSHNQMLGTRKGDSYVWKTYSEIETLCKHFGSGLKHLNLCPLEEHDGYSVRFIVVYSINREEWNIADIGALLFGIANVPFYDSLSSESIGYIFEQTSARTAVLSVDKVGKICDLKLAGKTHALQNVVSMDLLTEELRSKCQEAGLTVYDFHEIIEIGKSNPSPLSTTTQPDDLYSLSYTSGTTGNPKGVIITHKMMVSELVFLQNLLKTTSEDSYLSYLPAAHIYEKVMSNIFYIVGGKLGFYSGSPLYLRDDICVLKPTYLIAVPRILNRFADLINSHILKEPERKRILIENMIREKLENLEKNTAKHPLYDFLYFNKFKNLFGGKIRLGVTAAAPMNQQVLDRLKVILGINIVNVYGQTEIAGAASSSLPTDYKSGHVGGPGTCVEIKLVDIPEMGYSKDNKDADGSPAPSGEICFRGPSVLPRYFKNPQATSESFDSLGWLHTGDVGLLLSDGRIEVIDRKKSLLKLSQGEYVSPEKIENVNMQSKFVAFNFVYGNSLQSYLVAVVVPDRTILEVEVKKIGVLGEWEEICRNKEVVGMVLEDLHENGRRLGLNGIEMVKRVHLHPWPIGPESGLLTPTFKMKRKEMRERFLDELEAMYVHHR